MGGAAVRVEDGGVPEGLGGGRGARATRLVGVVVRHRELRARVRLPNRPLGRWSRHRHPGVRRDAPDLHGRGWPWDAQQGSGSCIEDNYDV